MSKNTLDDLTYVGKSTFGDFTKSAKEAVSKKGLLRVRIHNYHKNRTPRDFSL